MRVKKEITKLCSKLFMKVNLLIEFNKEKYNLNYKSHIYKMKTIRSSCPEVFCKKVFLKFVKICRRTPLPESFFK